MWSKPAPPSDSGMAMPVRPSSAALAKRARGKWPVSSSSLARGRTSDSANSRTVFWRRDCSSVRSRFMGGGSLAQKGADSLQATADREEVEGSKLKVEGG